jgi:hypothetical protein
MKKLVFSFLIIILFTPNAKSEIGINFGLGLPFIKQYGVDLRIGDALTFNVGYNLLDVKNGNASVKLSMPQFLINWHPFSGSFYLGVGAGKETLEISATDESSGASASADVVANTSLARVGWMWGRADSGFWFGLDATYVSPSGGEVNVEADGLTAADKEYKDVVDAGKTFGETAYVNFTFARFGWLF